MLLIAAITLQQCNISAIAYCALCTDDDDDDDDEGITVIVVGLIQQLAPDMLLGLSWLVGLAISMSFPASQSALGVQCADVLGDIHCETCGDKLWL